MSTSSDRPPLVDVIIPTQFDPGRVWSLTCQTKVALNQGVNARVVILCSEENVNCEVAYNFLSALTSRERLAVAFFKHPDGKKGNPFDQPGGYMCAPAIKAYLESETFEQAFWQLHAADDDSMTPWALRTLLAAAEGVEMVVGRAVAVDRNHEDRRHYALGESIKRCHVALSSAILKTSAIKKLARPLYNQNSGYADYELIARMAETFPHRLISQIVNVNPLDLPAAPGVRVGM